MSRLGKIFLTLAGFSFIFVAIPRVFLEEWHNLLFIPLVGVLVFLAAAVAKDIRFYLEFFTMKTTKHGANMGVLILLAIVLMATVNYLGSHFLGQIKFDWTKEKLNSLSEQSAGVLKTLDSDLEVKFFFGRGIQDVERVKDQFKSLVRLYSDRSKLVKVDFVDSIRQPDLAEEFKVDSGDSVIFIRYKGVRQRVEKIDEEGLTNAIIKVTHTKKRVAYFTTGHGERDIESREPTGLNELKQTLEGSQYTVKSLKLFEEGKVPSDADMVLVVGPQQTVLENEIDMLRNYARSGGRLLLALDPGMRHNLAGLVKSFGIEFANTFIVDPAGLMNANTLGVVLGTEYSHLSAITKSFKPNMVSAFYLASPLKRASDAPAGYQIDEIVKSGTKAVLTAETPRQGAKILADSQGSKTVVATATGKLPPPLNTTEKADKKTAEPSFTVIVAGDSDFLSNQFLMQLMNRDLALNSIAFLANDTDQITIRPKQPAGTQLNLSRYQNLQLLLAYVCLPIFLFLTGGVVWFRRKYA